MTRQTHRPNFTYGAGAKERSSKPARPPSLWLAFGQLLLSIGLIVGVVYGLLGIWQVTAPKDVTVPEVVKLDERAAEELLVSRGLQFQITGQKPSETIDAGKIIDAQPKPGQRVKQGRRINLTISLGSQWTNAPDIREMSERRALARLEEKSLHVGRTRYIYYSRLPKGFVVDQLPAPATRVPKDSDVHMLISQGPRPGAPAAAPNPDTQSEPAPNLNNEPLPNDASEQ